MNRKTTIVGLGVAAIAAGALSVGTAFASPQTPTTAKVANSSPAAETPGATDGDNVQQGDQTGPDTAGTETPTTTAPASAADVATAGDTADTEVAGSEAPGASDGPGGYADQNPNANTQQEGAH
jgi:hypothetical protein